MTYQQHEQRFAPDENQAVRLSKRKMSIPPSRSAPTRGFCVLSAQPALGQRGAGSGAGGARAAARLGGRFVRQRHAGMDSRGDVERAFVLLQFHGDETPAQCEALAEVAGLPWWRAVRVGPDATARDLVESSLNYSAASGLLLDTLVDGYGGGGKVFDWSLIPTDLGHRAVLSGGLNAQNVLDAIRRVRPYAVDVSSGIELAGAKGVKDHARMAAFVRAVREADAG